MTELQQKQLDFLNETVEFYGADPIGRRAYSKQKTSCMYLTPDGKKCAIGRKITKYKYRKYIENLTVLSESVFSLLPKKIQQLGQMFLRDIQLLHDSNYVRYWDFKSGGLTIDGQYEVNSIKNRYGLS